MIAGKECGVWYCFVDCDWWVVWSWWVDVNFWYGVNDKKYDFDRVVLFVDLEWLKSIDFTGVLHDWWDVN